MKLSAMLIGQPKGLNISNSNIIDRNRVIAMNKSNVSYRNPEMLEELYIKNKLSSYKIAEMLNVNPKTIRNWLEKFGIPRRSLSEALTKYLKKPFSGDLEEKSYLLGLRTGDIHATKLKRHKSVLVSTTTTKEALIKMFKGAFEKYSHVNFYEQNSGFTGKEWGVYSYLHPSFEFLIEKPQGIPAWILENDKYFYCFLAGYADSEGSWIITEHKKYHGKYKDLIFSLGTCDKTILEQIHQKLKELGFKSHLYLEIKAGTGSYNFNLYKVTVMHGKDVIKLAKILLPLSKHEEKQTKMLMMIELQPFLKRARYFSEKS